mmetsp:Transcript_60959/g.139435  ORF Transcript_60959/g.139435 Transcript_60959/m.139435 type:complete len:146 (+) Transcript_60959:87-524(+)
MDGGADLVGMEEGGEATSSYVEQASVRDVSLQLLNAGADISAEDIAGATPLHGAASRGSIAMVRVLLAAGADVEATDRAGASAEDRARARPHLQVATHLAVTRRVARERARCIAFAMGLEERLGAGSLVRALDPGVVRMVLDPKY